MKRNVFFVSFLVLLLVLTPYQAFAEHHGWSSMGDYSGEYCESVAVYGDRLYAVLGGNILYSRDGRQWENVDDDRFAFDPATKPFYQLFDTHNLWSRGDCLFALGWEHFMGTRDGDTWHVLEADGQPIVGNLRRIITYKDRYLMILLNDDHSQLTVYTSPDGIQWEVGAQVAIFDNEWASDNAVEYQDKLVLALNETDIIVTEDGATFELYELPDKEPGYQPSCLSAYDDGENAFMVSIYFRYDYEPNGVHDGIAYVSHDGRSWRRLMADGELVHSESLAMSAWGESVVLSTDDKECAVLDNALPTGPIALNALRGEAFHQYRDFPFGEEADVIYYGSGDFSFGEEAYSLSSFELRRIESGAYAHIMGPIGDVKEIASAGEGTAIAAGNGGLLISATFKDRTLRLTTHQFNPDGSGIKMLDYQNGRYWLGTYSGALYASEDGLNYTGMAVLPSAASALRWDGSAYWLAADDGLYTSGDGHKWIRVYDSAYALRDIAIGDGEYAACGAQGLILTSLDGIEWTRQAEGATSATLYAIAYGNGAWITGGGTGSGGYGVFLGKFGDGSWAQIHDGEEGFTPNKNGDVLFENCPYSILFVDGLFHAVGLNRITDGFHMVSEDGRKWAKNLEDWGKDIAPFIGKDLIVASSGAGIEIFSETFVEIDTIVEDHMLMLTPDKPVTPLFEAMEPPLTISTK